MPENTLFPRPAVLARHVSIFAVVLGGLYLSSRFSYLLFHALSESFRMAVELAAFIVVLNARRYMDNGYLTVLGPAFLASAMLTLLHTLAYKGMGVFPGYGANLPTQFWIASRFLLAISLAGAPLFISRRPRFFAILAGYMAAAGVLAALVFTGRFPDCFVEGQGLTPFKVRAEYAICLLLALAAFLAYRRREHFDRPVLNLILWGILFAMASELAFTFYVSVYGLSNLVGHMLIIVSTYLIYRAIVVTGIKKPHDLLFRKLAAAHSRLRLTIDLVPHMIHARDADGRLLLVNTAMARALGSTIPGVTGRLLAEVHPHPEQVEEILKEDARVISGRAVGSEIEEAFTDAGGGERVLTTSRIALVPEALGVPAVLAVSVDVTRERQDQALREDIERIIRHDLRSPLSGMISLPGLLAESDNLTGEQREILEMIASTGRGMMEMLNDSLDMYKLETGTYELSPAPVDLPRLARRVADNLGILAETFEVRVELAAGEDGRGLEVPAEEDLLQRLVANLLANAIEASPPSGVVRLEMDGPGRAMRFINAGAVPREVRDNFFEKYATWGKKRGTGLGTYSARLIARAHGWDIAMRTSEESGTVVEVRFA